MTRFETARRYASVAMGLLMLGLSLWLGFRIFAEPGSLVSSLVLACLFLVLGLGLIWRNFWAQRLTAAFCVLLAILLPVGYINPFMAMDTHPQPTLRTILFWMIPTVVGLLASAWLIDPPGRRQPNNRWRGP